MSRRPCSNEGDRTRKHIRAGASRLPIARILFCRLGSLTLQRQYLHDESTAEFPLRRESSSDAGAPVLVSSGPQTDSNFASAVVILAKATIGAGMHLVVAQPEILCEQALMPFLLHTGLAALPLTDAMLGWPLATIFLLAMAYATQYTLKVLIRYALLKVSCLGLCADCAGHSLY